MTTQTVHIQTYDYGASLSSATLRVVSTDVLVATADSVNEVTADSGLYAAVFGEASVIAAGEYRLRAIVSGKPINRYVTLGGTDGEIVQARNERLAVLDSATQTQLDAIETDVAALAAAGEITITSPVVDMGADGLPVKIEIVQGADYLLADSTQIAMSLTGTFPAWTSAAAYLDILCGGVELSLTGTITTATGGTRALYFELTATQSATLVDSTKDTPSQDIGVFDLRVVLSNTHVTYPINRGKFVSRRRSQA